MKFSKLPRLYISELSQEKQEIEVQDANFHYIKNVLHLKTGQEIRLFNEEREFLAEIISFSRSFVKLIIHQQIRIAKQSSSLTLAFGIIKPDKLTELIRSCTALGVNRFQPIIMKRSQYNSINLEKLNKVSLSAIEQSEQFTIPTIESPIYFDKWLEDTNYGQLIWANEDLEPTHSLKTIKLFEEEITLLIGPEGGITPEEQNHLKNIQNSYAISLGDNILRSELAAISIVSCVNMLRSNKIHDK